MNTDRPSLQSGNRTLASAKAAKQDEFYTQLGDIRPDYSMLTPRLLDNRLRQYQREQ